MREDRKDIQWCKGDFTDAGLAVLQQRDVAPGHADDVGQLRTIPLRLVSSSLRNRKTWIAASALATVGIHIGFAAFFLSLLDVRDLPTPLEKAIPVEVVASIPEVSKPKPRTDPPPPASTTAPPPKSDAPPPPPFLAPPPETRRAAAKPEADQPVISPPQPRPLSPPTPPATAPNVMTAESGAFEVAPPAFEAKGDAAPIPPRPTLPPDASAKLAQALPMDLSAFPTTFQAVLSGGGAEISSDYRGLVYGRIRRSHLAMDEARARHLRGQVAVSFSIDDLGHVVDLKIVKPSGHAALDALGLAMVREAEPFPPPPQGVNQVFMPTFAVGEE